MEIKITLAVLVLSIISYLVKEFSQKRKAKIIELKAKNAITLDKFINYLDTENLYSKIVSKNVTRHLRNHYNVILVDLDTSKEEKIYTYKKILIINIQLMDFALQRNAPIDPCFKKSA